MKTGPAILLGGVAIAATAFAVYMVDIDQTEEESLQDVDKIGRASCRERV